LAEYTARTRDEMTESRWNAGQAEGNGQHEELSTLSTASTHVMSLPQVLPQVSKGQAFFSKLTRAPGYTCDEALDI